jgi:hypothetical protein
MSGSSFATTPQQKPWVSLKFGGTAEDEAHNDRARNNNANLATPGMLKAAQEAQESTARSASDFDARALNSFSQMADIDSRNLNTLSPNLALPKNPAEELRRFYADISSQMKNYLA